MTDTPEIIKWRKIMADEIVAARNKYFLEWECREEQVRKEERVKVAEECIAMIRGFDMPGKFIPGVVPVGHVAKAIEDHIMYQKNEIIAKAKDEK